MDSASAQLARELVDGFRPFIEGRLRERGLPDVATEVIDDARSWLEGALAELLSRPYEQQRRTPLELFQEAMRFPTEALAASGAPIGSRDAVTQEALPGDVYGLAPASSVEIGETVWEAHIAWGLAKAAYLKRPVVGLVSADLMDRSKIEPVVTELGMRLVVWADASEIPAEGGWGLVDLSIPWAGEAMTRLADAGAVFFAYGSHVDELIMNQAREMGARNAVPRSRFFRRIADFLPRAV